LFSAVVFVVGDGVKVRGLAVVVVDRLVFVDNRG